MLYERTFIDILTPKLSQCPGFQVDTTKKGVNLVTTADNVPLYNGRPASVFANKDNINLLSVGYIMPDSFKFYQVFPNSLGNNDDLPLIRFNLNWSEYDDAWAVNYPYPFWGKFGTLQVPMENYECFVNTTFNDLTSSNFFELNYTTKTRSIENPNSDYMRISMVNVPDVLHGEIFRVVPFVKVQHNIEMILRSEIP